MSTENMGIKPLAVWDVKHESWFRQNWMGRRDWLRAQELPANQIYRIEFYLLDTPFARLFRYALNQDGRKHWIDAHTPGQPHDHEACHVAMLEPLDVPLPELPPSELL